ncbi:MAG: phosphatidylinositol-3-phosphatase, partial [Actinomycetota bacterium]|nr:phosphatidylinositol-3-phosphatase [Actinomycetota bacterium]
VGGCSSSKSTSTPTPTSTATPTSPPTSAVTTTTVASGPRSVGHVFVINLENEDYATTWGPSSPARYLNGTLVEQGKLLTQYFGIGHASLDNYIAQISGQSPNPTTQADCVKYVEFTSKGTGSYGQALGQGCVYPAPVKTIGDQLTAAGKTWRAYQEDMGTPCRHPVVGGDDSTLVARKGDMYATRHNPFVYFHSIIDEPACAARVVDLKRLASDLQSVAATPNLVYITPNLCHDGHDAPCVDGQPGGLVSADRFLAAEVPKILASPAYKADGMVVITVDEASFAHSEACCGTPRSPNVAKPGLSGPGGGRVGTLLVSSRVTAGTTDATPYNHYSLLCSIENMFGLAHLGFAGAPGLTCFGKDVYDASP